MLAPQVETEEDGKRQMIDTNETDDDQTGRKKCFSIDLEIRKGRGSNDRPSIETI